MCRVDLNHTSQPCSHRWYHLLSSCTATSTLSSCPGRLAIEGWEIKCDFCPFCAGWDVSSDDFMILGGHSVSSLPSASGSGSRAGGGRHGSISSAASMSSTDAADSDTKWRAGGLPLGVPLSRQPSLAASVSGARKASRSSSFGTVSSADVAISPYEIAGPVLGAYEKNHQMNARIVTYIDELPELAGSRSKRSKSKFRKSRGAERDEVGDQVEELESSSWKRRSKSIVDLMRKR